MGCRFVGETISQEEVGVSLNCYLKGYNTFKECKTNT